MVVKICLCVLSTICGILFGRCSKDENEFVDTFFDRDATKKLIEDCPYFISNHHDDWNVEFIGSHNTDSLSVRFSKKEQDTLKNIAFAIDEADDPKPIAFLIYEKIYHDGDKRYVVNYNSNDTLYCYYTDKGQRVFVNGGYYYKGTHVEFDSDQQKYYILHRDSLDKVEGNHLPDLPSLSEDEARIYESLYGN